MICLYATSKATSQEESFECDNVEMLPDMMTLEYNFHTVLERALYSDMMNIFNIGQGGFKLTSGSRLACIPVTYSIARDCSGGCNTSCPLDGSTWTFLWSTFDTKTVLGQIFLHYAIYGLRVFGFEWENQCDAYQIPVNINLTIPSDFCVTNDTYQIAAMCAALDYITTLV